MEKLFDTIFQETLNDIITDTGVIVRSGNFSVFVDKATYDDMMDEMFEMLKNELSNEHALMVEW